jgi:hypothetical protein
MRHLHLSLAAASALALVGCNADHPGAPTPAGVRAIRSATSFGFCVGYCRSPLEITSEHATSGELRPLELPGPVVRFLEIEGFPRRVAVFCDMKTARAWLADELDKL